MLLETRPIIVPLKWAVNEHSLDNEINQDGCVFRVLSRLMVMRHPTEQQLQ